MIALLTLPSSRCLNNSQKSEEQIEIKKTKLKKEREGAKDFRG
jgi:hypothetical protein